MDKKAGAFQAVSVWFQALKWACFLPGKGFSATSTGLYALGSRLRGIRKPNGGQNVAYNRNVMCHLR
jgi:hypothetical protein